MCNARWPLDILKRSISPLFNKEEDPTKPTTISHLYNTNNDTNNDTDADTNTDTEPFKPTPAAPLTEFNTERQGGVTRPFTDQPVTYRRHYSLSPRTNKTPELCPVSDSDWHTKGIHLSRRAALTKPAFRGALRRAAAHKAVTVAVPARRASPLSLAMVREGRVVIRGHVRMAAITASLKPEPRFHSGPWGKV